jgi:hypothetical protein
LLVLWKLFIQRMMMGREPATFSISRKVGSIKLNNRMEQQSVKSD